MLFGFENTDADNGDALDGSSPRIQKPFAWPSAPRLFAWALLAAALLFAVWLAAPAQLGVTLYKASLVSLAAVLGYWADRSLFPYSRPHDVMVAMARQFAFRAEQSTASAVLPPAPDATGSKFDALATVLAYSMLRRAIIVGCAMLAMGLGA